MARLKRGDKVLVIAGKDKGRSGSILRIAKGGQKVVVEKLNMAKRHTRPTQSNPHGGIIDKEMPLDISNVMLLVNDSQGVRVGFRVDEADGQRTKVRIARQTGDVIE
jgi:large subunit ribosomal protein L24